MATEKTASEWRTEATALRAEVADLKRQVAEAREFQGRSGVIDNDFVNRTSLGHLRNKTWKAFAATVRGLPQSRIELGYTECRTQSVSDLVADLYTLGLSPPRSTSETIRRTTAATMLESKAFFAVLSHPGTEYCDRCYQEWADVSPPRLLGRGTCSDPRGHRRGNAGYDDVRVRFIGEVGEVYYRPGIWSLFIRAPEVVMMPGFQRSSSANDGDD